MSVLVRLQPGEALPERRHRIDQALIDAYAAVSGDRNPLHLDPEFARTTQFGRTIAHGMMTLAFVSAAMAAWAGRNWARRGVVDVTFLSPVFPGDEVLVAGQAERPAQDEVAACRVTCTVGSRTVLVGRLVVPA